MALSNTIIVSGEGVYQELLAGASSIKPGMLMMTTGATPSTAVIHATAGGDTETLVVIEDSLQGATVDTAFTSGDPMRGYTPQPGSIIQFRLTGSVSYDEGDILISAGDGLLKKTTGSPAKVFGRIHEAVDYSAVAGGGLGKVKVA